MEPAEKGDAECVGPEDLSTRQDQLVEAVKQAALASLTKIQMNYSSFKSLLLLS
jgi:hypothetical protein